MKIYMLTYTHKHGDDISLHISEEARLKALADICRDYWGDAVERSRSFLRQEAPQLPLDPPEGDLAPVPLYFGTMADDESYAFDEYEVPIQVPLVADENSATKATVGVTANIDVLTVTDLETGEDLIGLRLEADGHWQVCTWAPQSEFLPDQWPENEAEATCFELYPRGTK